MQPINAGIFPIWVTSTKLCQNTVVVGCTANDICNKMFSNFLFILLSKQCPVIELVALHYLHLLLFIFIIRLCCFSDRLNRIENDLL